MIYIENSSLDPYYNQAFEEAVTELAHDDVLILWRNKRAFICGKHQNMLEEISALRAEANAIALVRRESGGGAVYHDEGNINYSIIMRGGNTQVDYGAFISPVIAALNSLGVPAYMDKTCDISLCGSKISGSAQKKTKSFVLHHATLLFDADLSALTACAGDGLRGHYRSKSIKSVRREVTNIKSEMKLSLSCTNFMQKLKTALAQELDVSEFIAAPDEIVQRANQLAAEKYRTWEWTIGEGASFDFEKRVENERGYVAVIYSAKRGIITDFVVESNIVGNIAHELVGKRLAPREIAALCAEAAKDDQAAAMLTECIF